MEYYFFFLLGVFINVLLLSRIALWLTNPMGDTVRHILVSHLFAYLIGFMLQTLGGAYGHAPNPTEPFLTTTPCQLIWLSVDLYRLQRRLERTAE